MSKKYASHFAKELIAAGVGGLPMVWDDAGNIRFDDSVTQAQRDTVLAVALAHDPLFVSVQDRLNQLEVEYPVTPRALREFVLLASEAIKQATAGAIDLAQVRGVAEVKAIEDQAIVLRAQL